MSNNTTKSEETIHRERSRWKCRRGMLELDLILLRFFDQNYATLLPDQRGVFDRLLDEEDPTLYEWFLGQALPQDKELLAMLQYILKNTVIAD